MQKLFGINASGAEFGETNDSGNLPGTLGSTYLYTIDPNLYSYYVKKGLTLFRLPFCWERVQNEASGPLSTPDINGLTSMLDAVKIAGGKAILDLHNYARYYNNPLVEGDTTLADVWSKLAPLYMNHPALFGFELMNEPHDLNGNGQTWTSIAQTVISAIRKVDKTTLLIVPGYEWQAAQGWENNNPNLNTITDPENNIIFSTHCYFDGDGSGAYWTGTPSNANGTGKITGSGNFIDWLQKNNQKGIVTEYGVPFGSGATTPLTTQWFPVLDDFLNTLNTSDKIIGGTAWSTGPWWNNYNLTIVPLSNGNFVGGSISFPSTPESITDQPSMAIYEKYPSTETSTISTPIEISSPTSEPVVSTPTTVIAPTATTPSNLTIPAFSFTGNVSISSDGKGKVSINITPSSS